MQRCLQNTKIERISYPNNLCGILFPWSMCVYFTFYTHKTSIVFSDHQCLYINFMINMFEIFQKFTYIGYNTPVSLMRGVHNWNDFTVICTKLNHTQEVVEYFSLPISHMYHMQIPHPGLRDINWGDKRRANTLMYLILTIRLTRSQFIVNVSSIPAWGSNYWTR